MTVTLLTFSHVNQHVVLQTTFLARLELQDPWCGILSRTVCVIRYILELANFKRQLKTFLFAHH